MRYMKLSDVERKDLMASLAAMKTYLREAFQSLTPDDALAPGPGGAFCPVEQVWHLADLERQGFGLRIRRLRTEERPHLSDFDGTMVAHERNYRALALREGIEAFEIARDANLAAFLSLSAQDWTRSGTQEGVGEVMLCDMPTFLQQHDQAHVAEIEHGSSISVARNEMTNSGLKRKKARCRRSRSTGFPRNVTGGAVACPRRGKDGWFWLGSSSCLELGS